MTDCSPTHVQDWMLCPQYYTWRHQEGWLPKTVGKNEIQAWIGRAIHAGISQWVRATSPRYTEDIGDAAQWALQEAVAEAIGLGRDYELAEAALVIRPTLRQFIAQAPLWLQTTCRGSEVKLGHAILDWIGQPGGDWLVLDFKTKRTKPREYGTRSGRELYHWELRRSWQFADYVERAMSHPDSPAYQQPVGLCEVQTIILDDFDVWTDRFIPTQPSMAERLRVSRQMEPDVSPIRRRSMCRNWFGGDCPYLRACWDYEGDPVRMTVDYVKEERSNALPGR